MKDFITAKERLTFHRKQDLIDVCVWLVVCFTGVSLFIYQLCEVPLC